MTDSKPSPSSGSATPGPWYVKAVHGEANHSMLVLKDGRGGWVACIQHNGEGNVVRQWADANLMAAAPELRDALKALLSCREGGAASCSCGAVENARAALRKAEGHV